jgi:negative regulator of flagellin synthesis FlgM
MRIDTRQIIQQVPGVKPKGLPGAQETGPADSVDLSTRAADIQRAIDALKDVPEVREEQVEELRAQVEAGTFDASGDSIAEKLVG